MKLRPLSFEPGSNTPPEVTRSQLLENIKRDLPWLEVQPLKDKPLSIIAGGPSLKETWCEIDLSTDVMALNNAYSFLLEREIKPDYFMLLDAREDNVDFLRVVCPTTKHLIAAQCHPSVFKRLESFNTTLYITTLPGVLDLTEHVDKPKVQIAGTVGTVGIKAMCMAYALGYRELHLYGYDSSYDEGEHHAFPQALNDGAKTLDVWLDGKKYVTTPTMAHQATEFCSLARGMTEFYGFDINVHGRGLLPDMVAFSNAEGAIPLEERERQKYEQIWEHNVYRKVAPGENMVENAIEALGMTPGQSVIDFGCGTGRASAKLAALGYKVTSIDHAANCVDEGLALNFVQACLWDLPDIKADIGYCTDVMEHIPSEKVGDVLKGISERVNGAYFNIATRDDSLGSLIGKKLHMTVMPAENWLTLLKQYWDNVEMRESEGEATFIVKKSSAS
jgi:hypothetical protein